MRVESRIESRSWLFCDSRFHFACDPISHHKKSLTRWAWHDDCIAAACHLHGTPVYFVVLYWCRHCQERRKELQRQKTERATFATCRVIAKTSLICWACEHSGRCMPLAFEWTSGCCWDLPCHCVLFRAFHSWIIFLRVSPVSNAHLLSPSSTFYSH